MHNPVLLQDAITGLNVKRNGLYIDATVGEAGHTKDILKLGGKVLAIDRDPGQIKKLIIDSQSAQKLKLVVGNFADIESTAHANDFIPADGILFDLGLSMRQVNNSGRGFSYRNRDEPLDMRLSDTLDLTAADVLNSYGQDKLYEILAGFAEEVYAPAISRSVIRARSLKPIKRVGDLTRLIDQVLTGKDQRTYARVFQALRIAVNDELDNLEKGLDGALKILKKTGRIVTITFHSLEDRIVKQFIRNKKLRQLNKKVNRGKSSLSFERSAKLRIFTTP
ncbi:16S rRNA (cytosine(1402)-N(4))-methyltransferase [Candidatus Roizmanbacteria bacterium RIFCSPHIGHO2_01_FULL_39_12c]|uniref:Ribosomal RNA small subunit methyltransferase H n=1 Tax=Candidatus Roizmanbacteria bacterium RIFCSPHIGHO2_01_FULL_39_12c TaxID=1802031 RepID=A0A1F7GEF6_9BACT|nr:MAG: 16S rRNA (cytosine(1402)-N(4))-methyltransferase [Candidatus Roizmanbacteria bacterium RIFCSPHIGHO2_01_FULL_39_12c]OGK48055.1 MAG: 16S rRNA (cytosine(1402)-N(4))-methyltransferase [Candidatus Roizmanbacteria bacterium RIFCSPLOWO2_01_FULL_40_13]